MTKLIFSFPITKSGNFTKGKDRLWLAMLQNKFLTECICSFFFICLIGYCDTSCVIVWFKKLDIFDFNLKTQKLNCLVSLELS